MKKALFFLFTVISVNAFAQCNGIPYTIHFDIVENSHNQALLVIDMKLSKGTHYVSPYSSDRFSGRFSVLLEGPNQMVFDGDFSETPRSVQIYDPHPFVQGLVNWVREDTRYEYPIQIYTDGDFEAFGTVQFTIEPRCTFEKIPYVITRKAGKLSVNMNGC